jgi:general secretion pathway protein A
MSGLADIDDGHDGYVNGLAFLAPPFLQSADPRFVCRTEAHTRALDLISSAVPGRQRLFVVLGAAGTGKTTLCLALQRHFGPRTFAAVLLDPPDTTEELLDALFRAFGLTPNPGERPAAASLDDRYTMLQSFLVSLASLDSHALIVVDEAQRLTDAAWDAVLRLTNFAFNHQGLLQLVLVGRPVLEERLQSDWLARRVGWRHTLAPLAYAEVAPYIERRLWIAHGGMSALNGPRDSAPRPSEPPNRTPRITRAARAFIANVSNGNPRLVNAICDRALAAAYDRGTERIGWWRARRAAGDLGLWSPFPWNRLQNRKAAAGLAMVLGIVAFLAASARDGTLIQANIPEAIHQPPASVNGESFDALRADALHRAKALASQPDVRALLKLQADVQTWDSGTSFTDHSRVEGLIAELERLTDEARRRQLDLDREQILKAQ